MSEEHGDQHEVCDHCGSDDDVRRRIMYERARMYELKFPLYYEHCCARCRGKGNTLALIAVGVVLVGIGIVAAYIRFTGP